MIHIAVLGYGTVGSGVVEVINRNRDSINKKAGKEINIKYVLDLRDFPGDPVEKILTHDIEDILNDEEVRIVIEVMGGIEPAYTYVKRALLSGKSVVTSNKELVAKHGTELLKIARERDINFLFEASVGGGIPLIRPLNQSLTADEIYEITGILNGTTNYILTKMTEEGKSFDEVLKRAQEKGYAERDPRADVEGHDACRKIAILSSLAFGMEVNYEDIYTEGITKITEKDILYAEKIKHSIKLLATSKKIDHRVFARVSPVLISNDHPLAMVKGVFNAVLVKGNVVGDVMFYGKGAGKFPTASAVVADVVDAVKHLNRNIVFSWSTEKMDLMELKDVPVRYFVRIKYEDFENAKNEVEQVFGTKEIIVLENLKDEFAFISNEETEGILQEKIDILKKEKSIKGIENIIRVEY
ncbi:MAG TPA: homoserine dehydrogenase [Defluviitaleaceae bacterium]|jgi:homoserine dehydrogenase|nr:homoserine dehydrogenase [Candidatus Epulonipiscium sp.]HOQ17042.1 homoserine dehydrogenase [Defluviitaleaceae bacterium]HPT75480.1 homoserine dehydrogenase [Defluviitaleaceae bacterium]HQD49901.1 homoserine dehydrogenase [Defluviitaleaceae bacterium]